MVRRLLSIWFPRLPSETVLRRRPVDGAFALTARVGNADRLHCLSPAAEGRGLSRGMPLADARAICPDLITRPADPQAESAMLAALMRWSGRYAPLVARDGADGIVADASGVPHLFGGEAEMLDDLAHRLTRGGFTARVALAGTRGAAHALARHGGGGIIAPGALRTALAPLPVRALRIPGATVSGLSRVGLERIGDLLGLPRAALARRFGMDLLLRLDQALGEVDEPVAAEPDPPHFGVRLTLPEPIGLESDVMAALGRLLGRLCEQLAEHRRGAVRLGLEVRRVDGSPLVVEVGLARPLRDPARILALFARGVAGIDAGYGIDALRLRALVTEDLPPEQTVAGGPPVRAGDALADLVSRLGNRLGFDRVQRLAPARSLIPERSFLILPAAHSAPAVFAPGRGRLRPPVLFPPEPVLAVEGHPPARFRWRRMRLSTLRAGGPERISPEWWLDDPEWRSGLRDYWRIETHQGRRLWLFCTYRRDARGTRDWFVQGEFT
ncbi:MAG: DNA polymerase Y family protein [Rubellimicrobium sp.]|nr:DNA polymerase Y family protein [Rubellimicrobium sp.]